MKHSDSFRRVWSRVQGSYESGYCVYERGMQAAMYMALTSEFPDKHVVVEPRWEQSGKKCIPDLAIVCNERIVDIFELKFAPKWYPHYREDEKKLLGYSGKQYVSLKPYSGDSRDPLPISPDCRLHFVVIGKSDSQAVYPEHISDRVLLWYGRISQDSKKYTWGICNGRKQNYAL